MFYAMNKLRHSPYFYTASGNRRQSFLCRRSVCPFYAFFPNPGVVKNKPRYIKVYTNPTTTLKGIKSDTPRKHFKIRENNEKTQKKVSQTFFTPLNISPVFSS